MNVRLLSLLSSFLLFLCLAPSAAGQVNNPPVAGADTITVHGSCGHPTSSCPNALQNDTDPDPGQTLRATPQVGVNVGNLGNFSIFYNGTTSFTAANGVTSGSTSISYEVCDDGIPGKCATSTVNINVVNSAPVAETDYYEIVKESYYTPISRRVHLNDSDADGDYPLTLGIQQRFDVPEGTLIIYSNGDLYFGRTTPYTFSGTLTFPYTICDQLATCTVGQIVIAIEPMDGGNNAGDSCPIIAEPVNVTTGNMWLQQTDYGLPGLGDPIEINRFYNSVKQSNGLFGFGWSTKYDESLFAYGDKMLRLNMPDGQAIYFARAATTAPFLSMNSDAHGQIVQNTDNSYTLTFKDGRSHKFSPAGRLLWQEDRNGNRTTLNYDGNGFQADIADDAERHNIDIRLRQHVAVEAAETSVNVRNAGR